MKNNVYVGADGKEYTYEEAKKMLKRYIMLKDKIKQMEAEAKAIGADLQAFCGDEKIQIASRTLSVSDCSKTNFNTNEFMKEHPVLARKFMTVSTYKRLNVK